MLELFRSTIKLKIWHLLVLAGWSEIIPSSSNEGEVMADNLRLLSLTWSTLKY